MSFRDSVLADKKAVFLNCSEFADPHDIRYDGVLYEGVPCLMTHIRQDDRTSRMSDHAQGIYLATISLHFDVDDLKGNIPEKGAVISVSDGDFMRDYYVGVSRIAEGMVILELEAMDE